MKKTNYQLFDFLDFDSELPEEKFKERLWVAQRPSGIEIRGKEIVLTVPFHAQKQSKEISLDTSISPKSYLLKLSAYGDNILRVSVEIDAEIQQDSAMLDLAPGTELQRLYFEKNRREWIVKDEKHIVRAIFNFQDPEINYWSSLLPPPDEALEATFFPNGKNPVKINAYDQFFPARKEAIGMAFVENQGKPDRVTVSFYAKPDEKFVGTGERFLKMDLSGQTLLLKNQDGQGVNNHRTYKNIPFYMSSEHYGLFLHTSAFSKFSLADHSTRSAQILVEEPVLDLFLIGGGNPEEITYRYRQLTGFPALPPLWSFGIWMSKMSYFSAEEVVSICDRLRAEDFPCDVIHLDTGWFKTDWLCEWKFNLERFPDPEKFIADLKADGYRVSLWQMPYIASEAEQYKEAKENNFIGPLKAGRSQNGSNFSALDYAGTIDFTYPDAVQWYQDLLRKLLDMGVACIKTDFGEEIHLDADYHGMPAELLNNLYALLYQKAAFEITEEITGDKIVWARAGWAGSQRYPLHWGGDAASSWDGMAGSLKGGLHLGLSGFGFWSHDVPGFHGVPNFMNSVIPDDLYLRWTQFGVFTSHIRYHGTSNREPYHFPNIADTVRKWWKLRYAIIPYILKQSQKTVKTGYPVLRALIYHHPEDKICWHIDDQYFFGDDFLVAPIMNSENKRDVYIPEGEWTNFFSGESISGGKWLKNMGCPLEEMPIWVKSGSSIPVYTQAVDCTDQMNLEDAKEITIDDSFQGIWGHLGL
ncbi:glycoside hydrolase family 31 protein [Anditalea andensis]|uniref:Alpha-glucosidase n=1 Tax=Anditalea andensis TaxID=1048983 RepID=A0A074KZF4_9BACT|nr:alpha-xylosidase [Anditalea andensis]KEO74299.1 alpha-glucosidase [Anditalea andensis]